MACVVCAGFGVALGISKDVPTAKAATITELPDSDYYIASAGLRLVNDADGAALRFNTNLIADQYANVVESGTLIIPEVRYDGQLTLDDLNNEAKKKPAHVVTKGKVNGKDVDLWYDFGEVGGDTFMRTTAYLYDIPEVWYGARMIAVSYIKDANGNIKYTTVLDEVDGVRMNRYSMSDVASRFANSAEYADRVAPYIVDEVTLTYAMPDGSKQTETVAYGSKVSGPTYDKDYYVISGATDQYGNAVNFATYNATLPVTIDVEFLTKKTVSTQLIKDGYLPTNTSTDKNGIAYSEYRAWQNGSTATVVTEGIPNGYSSVYRLDWYQQSYSLWKADGRVLYRNVYDQTDISGYERVTFGVKLETNGTAHIKFLNGTIAEGKTTVANEWLFVELVQTSANVWSATVTNVDGDVYYTRENITRGSSGLSDVDSIASLLFQANSTCMQLISCTSTESTASVYFTEVIGQFDTSDFDNGIPENAAILWNHVWQDYYFTGGGGAEGEYAEDVAAPKGFNYVNYYSWTSTTSNDFPKTGHLNDSDISAYSDLWFAMKVVNGLDIYVQGGALYTGGDWLYVHMAQADDGTWTKTFSSPDGYSATQTNLTGYKYTVDYTNQTVTLAEEKVTLINLLNYLPTGYSGDYTGGGTGSYPRHKGSGVTTTAYFTDVLAIRKDEKEIVSPTPPSHAANPETFDPDISEDAVAVRTSIWRDDRHGLSTSTSEPAPEGFSNVVEFNWPDNPKNWAETGTNLDVATIGDASLDISKYSDLYFAVKMIGGNNIYICGGLSYTGGDWLYAHFSKASDGTWSLSLESADGYVENNIQTGIVSTTLKGLLVYHASTDAEPWNTGFYPTKAADATQALVYYTEVLGVPDVEMDERVIWSAVDKSVPTDDVIGIPTGFTSLYKYTNFTMDKFAALDLSNTVYEELRFGLIFNQNVYLTDAYNDFEGYASSSYANFRLNTSNAGQMYVVDLVNNGNGSWTVTINTTVYFDPVADANGNDLGTQNQPSYTATVSGNSLSGIMSTLLQNATGLTVYCTEVRGSHTCSYGYTDSLGDGYLQDYCACGEKIGDMYPFAHGIDAEATEVNDSIWRNNDYALSTPDQVAPAGFYNIEMYRWNLNSVIVNGVPYGSTAKDMPLTCLDEADVSGYDEVWFAMKNVGGTGFYIRGAQAYTGGDWLYYHLVKVDGAWTLSFSSPDGYVANNVQTGIVGDTLKDILSYNGYSEEKPWNSGAYPTKADGDTTTDVKIYFTEILGVIACDHTEGVKYVSNNNGTHNEVCANCNKVLNANLTCAGGEATCTAAAICSLCETAYGSALGHKNTTWSWGKEICGVCGETVGTAATIASSAIIDSANAHLTLSNNAAGVSAPAGFSSVTNLFSASGNTWSAKILGSADFAQADLSAFSEVWFAIALTGGHFTNTAASWNPIDADNQLIWFKFHMTQTATGVWTVSIYMADTLYGTFENRPGTKIYNLIENNNNGLRLVIYQQNDGTNSNADVNVYATEVLGVFETGISEYATNVWDHIWNADGVGTVVDVALPEGFTSVNKVTWSGTSDNNYWPSGKLNASTDISGYSDLWFAMKVENTDIWCEGVGSYTSGGWLYFHLHQNSDGSWSKAFRSPDGWYNDSKQQNLSYNNLKNLLEYIGGGVYYRGSYPNWVASGVEGIVYSTNVVGIKKCDSHSADQIVNNGDETHDVICSKCGTIVNDNVACSGGTATCTEKPVCSVCGVEYGSALGHRNGTWDGNNYNCVDCGALIGTVVNELDKQNVVLFENASSITANAETPAYITITEDFDLDSVTSITLNGVNYAATVEGGKIKINVIPKDVFGEYIVEATVVIKGKSFDITAPVLVVTDLITTNEGLLNVRKILRGADLGKDAQGKQIYDEFLAIGGKGGETTMNGDGYYMLGADISMTTEKSYVFGTSYVPFVGTFDGNGYILKNYRQNNWFSSTKIEVDQATYNTLEPSYRTSSTNKDTGVTTYYQYTATSRQDNYLKADQLAKGTDIDSGVYGTYLEGSLFGVLNGTVKNVAFTNVEQAIFTNIVHSGSGKLQDVYIQISDLQHNSNIYVPILFARGEIGAGTLTNVVIDVQGATMEVASPGSRFPSLGKWYTAKNVAVYGFDTDWISSDGNRGNVYRDSDDVLSDGSAAGIYVEYVADEEGKISTNGAKFVQVMLDDSIWKIVDGRAYLKRVDVSGTTQKDPSSNPIESGAGYNLVWNDDVVGAFDAIKFIDDTTFAAYNEKAAFGANLADLNDFTKKQIIVGDYLTYGSILKDNGIEINYEPEEDLYGLYTINNTIFVLSESEEGFMLAAQELCRRLYGWNQFTYEYLDGENAYGLVLNESLTIKAEMVGNFTSHVAFENRQEANTDSNVLGDMGYNSYAPYSTYVEMHNTLDYFSDNTQDETTREWTKVWQSAYDFVKATDSSGNVILDTNNNTAQVCYLAHGDADNFATMLTRVESVIVKQALANKDMTAINFMLEDNTYYCKCSACAAFSQPATPQLVFLNELAKRLRVNSQLVASNRTIDVEFFSYNAYSPAPTLRDSDITALNGLKSSLGIDYETVENVNYTVDTGITYASKIDNDTFPTTVLKAEDGLRLYWTSHEANHSFNLEHEANAHMYLGLLGWIASIGAENIDVFMYQAAYRDYFIPLNTWEYQLNWYQSLNKLGVNNHMFNLGNIYNAPNAQTGFAAFKSYIDSRAMTDINVTFEQLKDEFFGVNGYYGPAGPTMRTYFEELVSVYDDHKQGEENEFAAKSTEYTDVFFSNGGSYVAGWITQIYDGQYNTDYNLQAFFNGSYGLNQSKFVFAEDSYTVDFGQNTGDQTAVLTTRKNVYHHSNYGSQLDTLVAWYNYCQTALALEGVSGNATYTKRINVEALFPEYACLLLESEYQMIFTRSKNTANFTLKSATWVAPKVGETQLNYQDFYTRVRGLGVSVPSEFYNFDSTKRDNATVLADKLNGRTITVSFQKYNSWNIFSPWSSANISETYAPEASFFKNWGVDFTATT